MGHLGQRISALLDGQLSTQETERAWQHVHACPSCRDLVEREGWVKTRLAGLSRPMEHTPDRLVGSLRGLPPDGLMGCGSLVSPFATDHGERPRRSPGWVALGGGALGAAMVGMLAWGAAPADAPSIDRRAPVTHLVTPSASPVSVPSRRTDP